MDSPQPVADTAPSSFVQQMWVGLFYGGSHARQVGGVVGRRDVPGAAVDDELGEV